MVHNAPWYSSERVLVRIVSYTLEKKMLFLYSLFSMEESNVLRGVFNARVVKYFGHHKDGVATERKSPIFDMLDTCCKLLILPLGRC